MAMSTCIKCGSHLFEMVEYEPVSSAFKYMFIQCSACGGVIGTTEYLNIGATLDAHMNELKYIHSTTDNLSSVLHNISSVVSNIDHGVRSIQNSLLR